MSTYLLFIFNILHQITTLTYKKQDPYNRASTKIILKSETNNWILFTETFTLQIARKLRKRIKKIERKKQKQKIVQYELKSFFFFPNKKVFFVLKKRQIGRNPPTQNYFYKSFSFFLFSNLSLIAFFPIMEY